MPILVDTSQIFISSILADKTMNNILTFGAATGVTQNKEHLMRHVFLNTLAYLNKKFRDEYGKMYLCFDDSEYWRNDIFPPYKQNRRVNQKKSSVNWEQVYRIKNEIMSEMYEFFSFPIIKVPKCEADDVIGVYCQSSKLFRTREKILIISTDKDYVQLGNKDLYCPNIMQYSPRHSAFIAGDPKVSLAELILCGDTSDGIPNALSGDRCLVDKIRQKAVTKKVRATFNELGFFDDPYTFTHPDYPGIERNRALVDMSQIPAIIVERIEQTPIHKNKPNFHLMSEYCDKYELHSSVSLSSDFVPGRDQ